MAFPPPLAIALLGLSSLQTATPSTVARESYLMGTTLRVAVVADDRATGIAAIESAFDAVRRVDAMLSTWRDDSEIARLNQAPVGTPILLSAELHALLREASRWSRATGGAFDPSVGALVDAWNLRGQGRTPTADRLAAAREGTGLDCFTMGDSGRVVTRRHEAAWLDTGGFGKGVALGKAADALRRAGIGSAALNFGGQVLVFGGAGENRVVPVAHPSRRGEAVLRFRLREGSVATSAQAERWTTAEGRRLGHILDPRSGEPVPAWGSVTVVAADPAVADMLSTALFVLGPDAGARWAEHRTDVGVLFLTERDGRVLRRWNRALEPLLVHQPNQPMVSRRS